MAQGTVSSYAIQLGFFTGAPAPQRFINMQLDAVAADPVQFILVYFSGYSGSFPPGVLGQFTNNGLYVAGDPSEFEHWYHLLQSERPLICVWQLTETDLVEYVGLISNPEATGEGPFDLSPSVP